MLGKFLFKQASKYLGPHFKNATGSLLERVQPATDRVQKYAVSPLVRKSAHVNALSKHWLADKTGQTSDGKTGLGIFREEFTTRYKAPKLWSALKAGVAGFAVLGAAHIWAEYQHHETENLVNYPNLEEGSKSVMHPVMQVGRGKAV